MNISAYNGTLSFIVIILSTVLFGCTVKKPLVRDIALVPDGHIALLNKVPDSDRMEEIVVGGAVVGAVRYLPGEMKWET